MREIDTNLLQEIMDLINAGALDAPAGGGGVTLTPPVLSDFAWLNQQSATAAAVDETIHFEAPSNAATNTINGMLHDSPTEPFAFTIGMRVSLNTAGGIESVGGLLARDNVNGRLVLLGLNQAGALVLHQLWGQGSHSGGVFGNIALPFADSDFVLWLRIERTAGPTTIAWKYSTDGVHFVLITGVENGLGFLWQAGPAQVGFGVMFQPGGSAPPAMLDIVSWSET